jgi:hypothetical protein
MNNSIKALCLAAAGSGLLSGTAQAQSVPVPGASGTAGSALGNPGLLSRSFAAQATPAKHACKDQNSCSGQGGCKTGDQGCKGKNTCKGKGGCSTAG